MLSYQHAYHAGNFADVIKHITLCLICDYLTLKDKPLCYLETHAGRGQYDLTKPIAQKTGEYKKGVGHLWQLRHELPASFSSWLHTLEKYNSNTLTLYPGSPLFAREHLRNQDRLELCELHPQEFAHLKQLPKKPNTHLHFRDGMQYLLEALPPKERRGLIMIDPSYELKQEYKTIPTIIEKAYKKFATGVYCLWYPIVYEKLNRQLQQRMSAIDCEKKLVIELNLRNNTTGSIQGCGLWIVNPPYILESQLHEVLTVLKHCLITAEASIFKPR